MLILQTITKSLNHFIKQSPRPTIKSLKIKEAVGVRDEKLFERSEFFSSVAGGSVAFSQDFIVSRDFFGSFFHPGKNEHIDNHKAKRI